MKLKLPFSEEFLWDLYSMVSSIDEIHAQISPKGFKEILCPDLFKLRRYYQKKRRKKSFSKFVYYLKSRGYLREKRIKNQTALVVTLKGMKKIQLVSQKLKNFSRRKDNRLQMIMYDVPEYKKGDRDSFRKGLMLLGYSQLQKSIWVSPYNVLRETEKLIGAYAFSKYTRLFLVEEREIR